MTIMKNQPRLAAMALLCLLSLGGCTNMDPTQQRVLSGAAIGAASGAGIAAATGGCITCGAAVGTAVGAGAGYVIDQMNK